MMFPMAQKNYLFQDLYNLPQVESMQLDIDGDEDGDLH